MGNGSRPAPRFLDGSSPAFGQEVRVEELSEAVFEDGPVDVPIFIDDSEVEVCNGKV